MSINFSACLLQTLKTSSKAAAKLFGLSCRLVKTPFNRQSTLSQGTSHDEWKHFPETIKFLDPIFFFKYKDNFCLAILRSFILQY